MLLFLGIYVLFIRNLSFFHRIFLSMIMFALSGNISAGRFDDAARRPKFLGFLVQMFLVLAFEILSSRSLLNHIVQILLDLKLTLT